MTIDKAKLKALAEAATPGPWSVCGEADSTQGFEIIQDIWNEHGTHTGKDVVVYEWSDESDPLGVIRRSDADFIAAANPAAVLELIAENERLKSVEFAFSEWIDKTDWVQQSAHWSELGMHRADVLRKRIDKLKAENELAVMRIRELDLLFGRYLIAMRSSLIEEEHGKGPAAAMEWIYNSLAGPGELPPEGETDSQAYSDREIVAVDRGMDEVMAFHKARRAAMSKGESSHD